MEKNYEKKYHQLETHHWWFKGRRDMLLKLLKEEKKEANILEIGCSGGIFLKQLQEKGFAKVKGIDVSKEAIKHCKKEGLNNTQHMDGAKTTFASNKFDVIIASDVLEHIKEDKKALTEWRRILKPGGKLLVFVPAYQLLWSSHDEVNKHHRRYTQQQLVHLLQKTKYSIITTSYWNFLLFFPTLGIRLLQRILPKKQAKDDLYQTPTLLNKLLYLLLKLENSLLKIAYYPLGVSVFAKAKK